jgi:hypothetical protein
MPNSCRLGDRQWIVVKDYQLLFKWKGDRWVHSLEHILDTGHNRTLARSVEGDPSRDDPSRVVSPVYQQLHFQTVGSTHQALLVGQSGPHHFSAVFSVDQRFRAGKTDGPDYEIIIKVDVADRCRGPVEALASTYTVDARSDDLVDANPFLAIWNMGPNRLTFAAIEPARVSLAEAGRRATQIQALAGHSEGSPTNRFVYYWLWDSDLTRSIIFDPRALPSV